MFVDLNNVKSVGICGRAAPGGTTARARACARPALAAAECCCSNSTLETGPAEPLQAGAAVLGSVFSKNQISGPPSPSAPRLLV